MKHKARFFSASLTVILLLFTGSFVYGQATVTSDHDDYAPLSTAVFTGSGFAANETVVLKVKNLNQPCNTVTTDSSYLPWTVAADQNGAFVTSWTVCNCPGDSLRLKAVGQTSGLIAYAYFTDANLNQVSVGSASQSVTYGTAAIVTYTVGVRATGTPSALNNVALTIAGLPTGVTFQWSSSSPNFVSPNIINFTGPATINVTLSVTVPNNTNVPASPTFTVTATAGSTTKEGDGSLTINRKSVTGSITADNKIYDGTTTATILTRGLTGVLFGDDVSLSGGAATFADKNIGIKTVTATGLSLSGTKAGNYMLGSTTATTTAEITAKSLTATFTIANKTYDGSTTATITDRQLSGVISGETSNVTLTGGVATFVDKNVGVNKTVSVSGATLTGVNAGNYIIGTISPGTANITARSLSVTAQADNRVYNGTTSSSITPQVDALQTGDVIGTAPTQIYDTKNVGTSKTLTASGLVINDGNSGNNYVIHYVTNLTGIINKRDINVTAQHDERIYNGTTSSSVVPQVGALQTGDVISTPPIQNYNTKNVGTNKTLTPAGLVINDGNGGLNYLVHYVTDGTGIISSKDITGNITVSNKVYDGTTDATIATRTLSGVIGTDVVSYTGGIATFDDIPVGTGQDVGNNKPVTATGLFLAGADAINYTVNTTAITTANITQKGLTITADNYSPQYSDPVVFTVSYAGFATGEGPADLGGSLTFSTTPVATSGTNPVIATGAPGIYTITPGGLTSSNYAISFKTGILTITKEDAQVTYTGLTLVATTTPTSSTATLTLSATIQDITAILADPAYDANQGDIRKATVTFNVDGVDKATVPIGLVNGSDTKTGTAVCNLPGIGIGDHTILVKLNGYYIGTAAGDNAFVVQVFQNTGDFITGGGYLRLVSSGGQIAGDAGTKNNFGFNIKYNKGGTNLQGTINTIIRRMEGGVLRIYQVKGSSMTSLTVKATATPKSALFNGKANITDITIPSNPVSISGNATLQVSMTDFGEPGSSDKIAITVFNKDGGIWYASNWDGSKTIQQTLSGGNVVVHSSVNVGNTSTARTETVVPEQAVTTTLNNPFTVKVYSNPASDHFNINIQGSAGKISLRIIDVQGRVVGYRESVPAGTLQLGQSYRSGFYYLEVRQGNTIKQIKLVKL